jgi:precorrin-6B methylase 2
MEELSNACASVKPRHGRIDAARTRGISRRFEGKPAAACRDTFNWLIASRRSPMRQLAGVVLAAVMCAWPGATWTSQQQTQPARSPDVGFVPTRPAVAEAMLDMAKVTAADVVYDLGCGDGQIVVAAAKRGARVVGVDIDPRRVVEARANALKAGVADRATIIEGDIFDPKINIGEASVVTLYLLTWINEKLKPRLLKELTPGTRVVSNTFRMGDDWPPEQERTVENYPIYLWTIPKR